MILRKLESQKEICAGHFHSAYNSNNKIRRDLASENSTLVKCFYLYATDYWIPADSTHSQAGNHGDSLLGVCWSYMRNRGTALLLAGDIPPRPISQASITGRLTHYLYFWDNLFLRSISGYQLLPNVGSNTRLTMAQWLNYNSIWSLEGRLKNFATDGEDPFIFGGMTRYWVFSHKMKKKNDSILNTQCSDKWIFSRLPQWSAGDLFQTGIQVLRLTRISFSTIYWGEENRRFPSYENAISVWFKHHFPTGQLQVRGEFRHDNEGGYWYQEENRAGFIGQAGK